MIIQFADRQGFQKTLSGVSGTSIQSAFTKPLIASDHAFANISWLPFPYGELPDEGPWIDKENQENSEKPTPDTPTPGAQGGISDNSSSNVLMFAVVVGAVWFLMYHKR